MTALYRDTGYTLNQLVFDICEGRIALPDIQRPFVWPAAKARDLIDSMYRGFPIGTVMLWETGAENGIRTIGDVEDRIPNYLIVDGQQRLTSLYAVLTGKHILTRTFEKKRIRIAFKPSNETFEVTDAAIERDPEYISDITALWAQGRRNTLREFLKKLDESREGGLPVAERDLLEDRLDRVHELRDFRFQVIEIDGTASEEQVAEIFVRINSEGVKLNQADFILTLMSVHWEKGRLALEAFSRAAITASGSAPSPRNAFIDPTPDQLLRVAIALGFRRARLRHVYSILHGKDVETGKANSERRAAQFETLAKAQEHTLDLGNWHEFLKCIHAAGFRVKRLITSENALLYSYALWLIGRIDFGLDLKSLRAVISRWFFMAHTTGRYSTSSESQVESDLGRISDLPAGDGKAFIAELDRIVAANFTNDYWEIGLPNRLDTSAPRSPALSAYLAALNLHNAEVLFSDTSVRQALEPNSTTQWPMEHLFPRKHLASNGITGSKHVNAIANMTFLDRSDHIEISASAAPSQYWPLASQQIAPEQLKRQSHHHALPLGWEQLDYATFLQRRRALMAKVTREGFARLWGTGRAHQEATVHDLIAAGESQTTEFKSSARWNSHSQGVDSRLEHVIVKTVCGFLNSEGGTLLIGVDDAGNVIGLQKDFETVRTKPNVDGYELCLRNLLDTNLTQTTAATVRIRFEQVSGMPVCVVSVAASGKPVFARPPKGSGSTGEEFWVRSGNCTKQLHGDDLLSYKEERWG